MELGYRGSGEVIKREEFEAKKEALEAVRPQPSLSRSASPPR